ncbi:MAG: cellulase family glycosylhydrolase [Mycobacteriales bacterium]
MGSHRRAVAAVGSLAVALGAVGAATATGAPTGSPEPAPGFSIAAPTQPIGHAGRWLTDGRGRVVVIHGVNVSMKGTLGQSQAYRFGADDAAFLASIGLNAVRLTVERYDIEPTPGHFDTAYLGLVRAIVRTLNRYGVMTLIDFHQDEYGPVFHDNGFPAWMTSTGGLPNDYQAGFPYQYVANPATNHAFDTFWQNGADTRGKPLWSDDAQIIGQTVSALRTTQGVLGYEIINEPWPGTQYATCLVPAVGCPSFDEGPLSRYYAAMDTAIRTRDTRHLVFYEPLVTFDYGIPTSVTPPPHDSRLGFAFHDYPLCTFGYNGGLPPLFDTECGIESGVALNNALSHVSVHPDALINDEFGAGAPPSSITKSVNLYDSKMIPWMFWSYQEVVGITPSGAYPTPPGRSPIRGTVDALARPYPQLVSGTPLSWSYSPTNHVLAASYSTARADGSGRFGANAVSQFEIPRTAYPHSYAVTVSGGQVVSGDGDSILLVAANPGARTVSLTVAPAT